MLLPVPDLSLRPTHNFWGTSRTSAACPVHGKWWGFAVRGLRDTHEGGSSRAKCTRRAGLEGHLHSAEGTHGGAGGNWSPEALEMEGKQITEK